MIHLQQVNSFRWKNRREKGAWDKEISIESLRIIRKSTKFSNRISWGNSDEQYYKNKQIKIGTWNVRSKYESVYFVYVHEMQRLILNIQHPRNCETRWPSYDQVPIDGGILYLLENERWSSQSQQLLLSRKTLWGAAPLLSLSQIVWCSYNYRSTQGNSTYLIEIYAPSAHMPGKSSSSTN